MDYQSQQMRKRLQLIGVLFVLLMATLPLRAQNNPYVDDKLLHFGFFLGLDMMSYHIEENDSLTQLGMVGANGNVYHPRTSVVGPGLELGFITDLRLTRHLNLRFTPGLHFGERSVQYKKWNNKDKQYTTEDINGASDQGSRPSVLTIPVSIPLYLKWSSEREVNYRPYVIVGGGVQIECFRNKEKVLLHKPFDAFVSAGIGCDFYFRWFKLCPEIKYKIGFLDAHVPATETEENAWGISEGDYFYTNAIKRMTHQQLSIVFNFE